MSFTNFLICYSINFFQDTSLAGCESCSYGQYCGSTGLTSPSGPCYAGFYCLLGAQVPNNPVEDATGGPCPVGHYCPNGTSYPLGCPPGTYSSTTGLETCISCPAGYFCELNATTYLGNDCPVGHYCPQGTEYSTQFPCDAGSYNPATGATQFYQHQHTVINMIYACPLFLLQLGIDLVFLFCFVFYV